MMSKMQKRPKNTPSSRSGGGKLKADFKRSTQQSKIMSKMQKRLKSIPSLQNGEEKLNRVFKRSIQVGAKVYALKHHIEGTQPPYPDSWEDKGHTLTVITPYSNANDSRDELFFDHIHIHPENWQWIHKRTQLSFSQGPDESYIGGNVCFSDDESQATGCLQLASEGMSVRAMRGKHHHTPYTLDLSTKVGAYVASDGLKLNWDTTTDAWANEDNWDKDAMEFSYWLEKGDSVMGQTELVTATLFSGPNGSDPWDVVPHGIAATVIIDKNALFQFSLNTTFKPLRPEYPYKMVFQFDDLALWIEGGAMLCESNTADGKVYALKGKKGNQHVVGSYNMMYTDPTSNRSLPTIKTHRGKLIVDGQMYEKSWLNKDRLYWSQLDTMPAPDGYVEFSPDGTRIIASSCGVYGFRMHANEGTKSSLNFMTLLNMNPYGHDTDGKMVELVQQSAMSQFYKIVQYFMPPDLLHNFISTHPPDLGDAVETIANDNAGNKEFYADLATPYLTNALKTADRESVKKLNAIRAQTVMQQKSSSDPIYWSQTKSLYNLEWTNRFPPMNDFLVDQALNTEQQQETIKKDARKWKAEIENGMTYLDNDQLTQMKTIAEDAKNVGLSGKYWAYVLFRYLSSDKYLSVLRMYMTDGNTSQPVTQDIQRYCSILNILDSTSSFSKLFIEVVQILQFTAMLPSFFDAGNNLGQITELTIMIVMKYIQTYKNSPDPALKQQVEDALKALDLNSIKEYMDVLLSILSLGNQPWSTIAEQFNIAAEADFGQDSGGLTNMIMSAISGLVVVQLCTGMIDFSDLSPAQQVKFLSKCFTVMSTLIRKGIQAAVAYESTSSLWEAFKVFFGKDMAAYQDNVTSTLGRWVTNNVEPLKPESPDDLRALFFEEPGLTEQYPRFTKMMGRSLDEFMATRFAAFNAIIGIVISSLSFAESKDILGKAMNSLFMSSSILDLTAVAAKWLVAEGVEQLGSLSIASISSIAGPLSIAAAVAGIIVMIVKAIQHKEPPNPIDEFVDKIAPEEGFYMEYGASIEYLQEIPDSEGRPKEIGVTFGTSDGRLITVPSDNYRILTLGEPTYGYDTVFSITVDYQGQCNILTRVWQEISGSVYIPRILAITFSYNNDQIDMESFHTSEESRPRQYWLPVCTGGAQYDSDGHLKSANFHIQNQYNKKYLAIHSDNVHLAMSDTPMEWTLSMEGMKPDRFTMSNIVLNYTDMDRKFHPHLGQVGSLSNQVWSLTPALPDFMMFDEATGIIAQQLNVKLPDTFPVTPYAMTVSNDYGSATTNFTLEVAHVDFHK